MKHFGKLIFILLAVVMVFTMFKLPADRAEAKSDLPEAAQDRLKSAVVLYIGSSEAYVNNQKKLIDGSNPEVTPLSKEGRSLVPVRFVAESLGAKVDWEGKSSTITISKPGLLGKTIRLVVGEKELTVNGKKVTLDRPAETLNGRTFVPFRAITEAMGKKVFYDRGLIVISDKEKLFDTSKEKTLIDGIIAKVNNLPAVGTEARLNELLAKMSGETAQGYLADDMAVPLRSAAESSFKNESAAFEKAPAAKSISGSTDYSQTNVQVQGVDEADIVKTDGKYIYQVNNQKVVVAEVYPPEDMRIISMIEFGDNSFQPTELYIDSKRLVVIGSTHPNIPFKGVPETSEKKRIAPEYHRTQNLLKAIIYDISDRSNMKKVREIELEGNYVSSRKIGSALYLVANKYINYYYIQNQEESPVPAYRDSLTGTEFKCIDYSQIRYFPDCISPNYMIVAGIDLDASEDANVYSYLGSGQNIYASLDNLYVAVTGYETIYRAMPAVDTMVMPRPQDTEKTTVYKFSLDKGRITYLTKGDVPGRILNQFSMDEYDENFRIATTRGQMWRSDEFTSRNNVYILNENLSIIGKLEDIAPGERIYSTRFVGSKCYMVTFRQVDPLFVIDLTPENPKILGALKIPGYSDYLHPYDENHIIGFGKDTEETKDGGVLMQGMKMAVFDVSDVTKPKELFKEIIGGRGTDSELLRNHKALLFSKEKGLLAFPVRVIEGNAELKSSTDVFQGAYIYSIDMSKGFNLRSKITHISEEDYLKSGYYGYYGDKNIERLLYIDDALYSLSKARLAAHSLADMTEIKALDIK